MRGHLNSDGSCGGWYGVDPFVQPWMQVVPLWRRRDAIGDVAVFLMTFRRS